MFALTNNFPVIKNKEKTKNAEIALKNVVFALFFAKSKGFDKPYIAIFWQKNAIKIAKNDLVSIVTKLFACDKINA